MSKNELIVAAAAGNSLASQSRSTGTAPFPALPVRLAQQLQPCQPFSNDQEKQSFELFRNFTAHASSLLFSNEFWEHLVLQASVEEPAIKHIVLAIGALNKRFHLQESARTGKIPAEWRPARRKLAEELQECALVHYGKAASHTSEMIGKVEMSSGGGNGKDTKLRDAAFMACVLFVCYENTAGNYAAATIHLKSGLRILEEAERQHRSMSHASAHPAMTDDAREAPNPQRLISPAPSPAQVLIRGILCRLDLQNLTFSDTQDRYLYTLRSPIHILKQQEPPPIPHIFTQGGIAEASDRLVDEIRWLLKVGDALQDLAGSSSQMEDQLQAIEHYQNPSGKGSVPIPEEADLAEYMILIERCASNFSGWLETFERTCARQTPSEYSQNQRWAKLLQIYQKIALLFLQAGTVGGECAWDGHYATMEQIVTLVESIIALLPPRPPMFDDRAGNGSVKESALSFSLDMGIIFPLFVVGSKCRDPKLRRRAAGHLLKPGFQWREGRWDSCGAGTLIRRIIEIEEGEAMRLSLGDNGWYKQSHEHSSMDGLAADSNISWNGFFQQAGDIPEQARVSAIYPTAYLEKRELDVKFLMKLDEEYFGFQKEKVPFAF